MKMIMQAVAPDFNAQRVSFRRNVALLVQRQFQQDQTRTIKDNDFAAAAVAGPDIFNVRPA